MEYTLEDLETLLDSIPCQAWIKDGNGVYKYVNKSFITKYCKNKKDIIGNTDLYIFEEDRCKYFKKVINEIIKTKTGSLREEEIIIDGESRFFEIYVAPLANSGEKSKWLFGISREITLDKGLMYQVEKKSINSIKDELNKKIDVSQEAKDYNKIICNLTERVQADGISIFIYEAPNKLKLVLRSGIASELDENITINITYKEQKYLLLNNMHIKAVKIENLKDFLKCKKIRINESNKNNYVKTYSIKYENQLMGVLNIYYKNNNFTYIQDDFIKSTCDKFGIIIKSMILSNKLKNEFNRRIKSEKELNYFLGITTDSWGILGKNYDVQKITDKWTETFGWTIKELKKMQPFNLIHPDDRKRAFKEINFSDKKGIKKSTVNRCLCKNGQYKLIEWTWACIENGKKVIITGKDITEQKRLKEEKEKLEETIALENFKSEFFNNVSQEFKIPIDIIIDKVNELFRNLENDKVSNVNKNIGYINEINKNSYRLLRVVNNLIDVTKIDGGYFCLNLKNCNIVNVVENIIFSVNQYIKNIRNIIFDTCEEEIVIAIDSDKIEKIILNLISNAIKYTFYDGNIKVSLNLDKYKNNVVISIKNDGIGISKENIKLIDKNLKSSSNKSSKIYKKNGIGLSISKALIEMHGGKIRVNKNILRGAEFIFNIPIRKVDKIINNDIYSKEIDSKIEKCKIEFSYMNLL